jgi:sodium-dependent dicarboxylate transporter 2/3/5
MMVPISLGIIRSVSEGDVKEFPLALMLATAYAASIGGISTPVGSPPNLIALSFLREEGVEIPFLVWMTSFLPLSFIILVFLSVILSAILKTRINLEGVHERISQEREKLPPMTLKDWGTIGIFALTVFLWMSPSIFKAIGIGLRPDEGAVALFCASLLFVARIEDKDALKRINWGAILLFGGGLSMGSLIIKTGLSEQIGNFLFELLPRSGFLKVFIIALFVSFATEVTSNTATASVFVPILAGATQLMLTAAIAASFAFMLPVATPPNAIVYGTGHIKIKDMVKVGIVIDVLAALFLAVYMWMR